MRAAAEKERASEEARRRADEEARRLNEERARIASEEAARRRAEDEARRAREEGEQEAARRRAEEAEARRRSEEQARQVPSGSRPSFDCSKANRAEAYLICGDDALMTADGEMGDVYRALRNRLPEPERQRLDAQQRAWLLERSRVCAITGTTVLTPANRPGFVRWFLASTRERTAEMRAEWPR